MSWFFGWDITKKGRPLYVGRPKSLNVINVIARSTYQNS